jgi:hypothetical protein
LNVESIHWAKNEFVSPGFAGFLFETKTSRLLSLVNIKYFVEGNTCKSLSVNVYQPGNKVASMYINA